MPGRGSIVPGRIGIIPIESDRGVDGFNPNLNSKPASATVSVTPRIFSASPTVSSPGAVAGAWSIRTIERFRKNVFFATASSWSSFTTAPNKGVVKAVWRIRSDAGKIVGSWLSSSSSVILGSSVLLTARQRDDRSISRISRFLRSLIGGTITLSSSANHRGDIIRKLLQANLTILTFDGSWPEVWQRDIN